MASAVNIELVIQAGKSASTLGEIKQSIKDVTKALTDVKVGSKEFHELVEVLQDAKGNVKELRNESATLQNVANVAKILTSSFAVATSAMAAFGLENEEVTKSLQKVQGAFVLLESVKAFAESFKKAKEANDTFNASLLTNPYVLIAAAVAGLAIGIYNYSKSTDEASESTKKLNEIKLSELKANIEDVTKSQDKANRAIQLEIDLINIRKGTATEEYKAKQAQIDKEGEDAKKKLEQYTAEDLRKIKSYEADVQRQKELEAVRAHSDDIIHKNDNDKKLSIIEYNAKLKEQAVTGNAFGEIDKARAKTAIENADKELTKLSEKIAANKDLADTYTDLKQKVDAISDKTVTNQAARDQAVIDATRQKAQDELDKSLDKSIQRYIEQKELDDETLALLQLKVEKESDLAAINDLAISNNQTYKKDIESSIKSLQGKVDAEQKVYDLIQKKVILTEKEKDFVLTYEKQKAALKELTGQQKEVNQAIAVGYINREKFTKAGNQKLALQDLEAIAKAYESQADERKQALAVEIVQGQYQDIIAKRNLSNIRQEITEQTQLWILTKNSTIADADKKTKLDAITKSLTGLNRQAQVLEAGIKKMNREHFFTANQLKDVQKAISYMQAAENAIGAFGQLATQVTQQNADKRIAIYEQENERYTAGLKSRLDEGFISQQEYDKKKDEADKILQKKKREEQHKAFIAQKAISIVQAGISTALAIVNALATAPTFIAGIVFAALAGAVGAANIAIIASAKEPAALARGGVFQGTGSVTGNGGSKDDSVNAHLSNGESVMNAKSTRAFAPLLSAMNQLGGGVAFEGQKTLQNAPSGGLPNPSTSNAPSQPTRVYVTESDITRTQNKIKVIQQRSTW